MIEIFRALGVKMGEPTFRKYVQLGLVPRSRRVGRKGKHQGSVGVYPAGVVRRINLIKAMMSEGLTLQDIRQSFVFFKNEIDSLEHVLEQLFGDFERELQGRGLAPADKDNVGKELRGTRSQARSLVRRIERIGSRLAGAAAIAIQSPAQAPAGFTVLGEAPAEAGWSLRPAASTQSKRMKQSRARGSPSGAKTARKPEER